MEKKTKELKELTIKGLEPHLENLAEVDIKKTCWEMKTCFKGLEVTSNICVTSLRNIGKNIDYWKLDMQRSSGSN